MSGFRLADSVLRRVVNCIQEAMLTGVDCSDLLRQVRLTPDENDAEALVMTADYQQQVKEMHDKLEARAKELQEEQTNARLIIGGSGDSN